MLNILLNFPEIFPERLATQSIRQPPSQHAAVAGVRRAVMHNYPTVLPGKAAIVEFTWEL
jgi:hypothetical protein